MIRILNYHILPEVVKFKVMQPTQKSFQTVEGSHLNVTSIVQGDHAEVRINGKSEVMGDMIETPMGVAYVISRFIVPNDMWDEVQDAIIQTLSERDSASSGDSDSLEHLSVPDHVAYTNRENDRYDEKPASASSRDQLPASGSNDVESNSTGVLKVRRASVVPSNQPQGLLFKQSRARSDRKEHSFRVLNNKKQLPMERQQQEPNKDQRAARKMEKTAQNEASAHVDTLTQKSSRDLKRDSNKGNLAR